MKAHKLLILAVVFCLPAVAFGQYTDIYISLDGVTPAPNDANIFGGETIPLYIISLDPPRGYSLWWGTYWGTIWGTNWGTNWDRPWEQVSMALPSPLPAAGNYAEVMDVSFNPELGSSYDYGCRAMNVFGHLEAGAHFSAAITAIGAFGDKFGVEILEDSTDINDFPMIDEVVFTIVRPCEIPVFLTVNVEPNDIGLDTVEPNLGEHESCPGWRTDLSASRFPYCPDIYKFHHWTGDVNDPCSADTFIITDTNETVTAVFAPDVRECGDECHPILQGDLNEDCYTNFEDFSIYADMWLSCTHPDCD